MLPSCATFDSLLDLLHAPQVGHAVIPNTGRVGRPPPEICGSGVTSHLVLTWVLRWSAEERTVTDRLAYRGTQRRLMKKAWGDCEARSWPRQGHGQDGLLHVLRHLS